LGSLVQACLTLMLLRTCECRSHPQRLDERKLRKVGAHSSTSRSISRLVAVAIRRVFTPRLCAGCRPHGHWEQGFAPITGFYRSGVDTGWAFTWTDRTKKLQLNGAVGVTFNVENTATNYQSSDDFHFEWAAGLEFAPGFMVGVVGYDYRQITGDSGSGDVLGPFKGRVDAIGPGLSYTTLIGQTPVVLNFRHYMEFDAHNRWEGNSTFFSSTIRF